MDERTFEQTMEPERWRRLQDLFAEALQRPTGERPAFLDGACRGDEELRRDVEYLLRTRTGSGSSLTPSGGGAFSGDADPLAQVRQVGKYEILEKIGQGGFGTVYKGRDALLKRLVAIKTCTKEDTELRRRFFREAQIGAGLQHPNVTTVFELGMEGDVPYLVQEYLPGHDLKERIVRGGLSAEVKVHILIQAARGLAYAHEQGVVHRDIKPANLRILEDGTAKIMDFGIARLMSADTQLTKTGMAMGTVGYLAPEQLRGEPVDTRVDIFSFGVMAYELFSGRLPFNGETFAEISMKILTHAPPALREVWPGCPDSSLESLLNSCLAKQPSERPRTMGEVVTALERTLENLRTGAVQVSAGPPVAWDQEETQVMPSGARPRAPSEPPPAPPPAPPVAARPARVSSALSTSVQVSAVASKKRPWLPMVAVLVLALGLVLAWRTFRSPADVPPPAVSSPPVIVAEPVESDVAVNADAAEETAKAEASTEPAPVVVEESVAPAADPRPPEPVRARPPKPFSAPGPGPPGRRPPPRPPLPPPPVSTLPAPAADPTPPVEAPPPEPAPPAPPPAEAAPPAVTPPAAPAMERGALIGGPGPGVVEPRLVEKADAEYPARARRRRRAARVVVAVLVGEDGSVLQTLLKKPDDGKLGFNAAAVAAARRCRFTPATRDGVAGKMWTEVVYDFQPSR